MFGFDKLFDFNGDGKLDAFEKAAKMEFLYEEEKDHSRRKKSRLDEDYGSDHYGRDNHGSSNRRRSKWDDD